MGRSRKYVGHHAESAYASCTWFAADGCAWPRRIPPMDEKSQSKLTGEPIAIIGVGCRFPGAKDLESLWRILRDRVETVAEYPGGRFHALDRLYENMPGERTGFVTRRGGFLKDLDLFDANFFSISPRET